jgi:hypothetical protein
VEADYLGKKNLHRYKKIVFLPEKAQLAKNDSHVARTI